MRVVSLILVILAAGMSSAAADPQADDLATCRDRQAEAQARASACDNLLKADKVGGKDKAIALSVRGSTLINKRDYEHAIDILSIAVDLDPDYVIALNLRGLAYERKGQDDLAMADYNLALQKRPTMASPTTIAASSTRAEARCKVRSTISTCRSNTRRNSCSAGPIAPACAR